MSAISQVLDHIRIVLVEPAGTANVGSVARVMKNMGLRHLVLVNPQCDPLAQEARWMAVHAQELLETARQVGSLPEALTGCQRAIATTARRHRHLAIDAQPPDAALPWLLERPSALIFGPEDRGLSNQELSYAQRFVCIPTSKDYAALNLAQAVAVCCYELHKSSRQDQPGLSDAPQVTVNRSVDEPLDLAPLDQMEAYYEQLEVLLLDVGFLHRHTAQARMMKVRRLFQKAQPSASEIALLRGMVRQINWKLSQSSSGE